ncbi:MAG: AAA family ATPase [Bacteroidota bacterium]
MSKIKIKYFGPIKDNDGWIDIKKVTVFIGDQGSGKSTVAKLISIFSWIEKVLTRGDYEEKWFTRGKKFRNELCTYHGIENYFISDKSGEITYIAYQGDAYYIEYREGQLSIKENG